MFHYFSGKISRGFVSLYSARLILRISAGLIGIFTPLFLYEIFDLDIKMVIYWYGVGYLAYGIFVALGAKFLNKIGLRRSLRIAVVLGAMYQFVFYFMDRVSSGFEWRFEWSLMSFLLLSSLILLLLNRILYWIPFHTDVAKFTDKNNRGREVSLMNATILITGAIMPVVAGWILSSYSYEILFLISLTIYLIALLPLLMLPRTKERFSWTYWQTWREFFSKKRRRTHLAFAADGAEQMIALVIWPIFMWEILDGNYLEVGVISSLVIVLAALMQLLVGKFLNLGNMEKTLKWGSIFYAIGWVIKIFIASAFQIFVASAYHKMVSIFSRTPFDALTYEKAADQGHFVDEYTVLHEMAISWGRVFLCALMLVLLVYFDLKWVFILAAVSSLALNFLADSQIIEKGRHAG